MSIELFTIFQIEMAEKNIFYSRQEDTASAFESWLVQRIQLAELD